ncbi:MAG TPA: sialidase family protein [Chthonomonadales bacterium]|nr:sialidase family protein [Chthonomonadales bacterium]
MAAIAAAHIALAEGAMDGAASQAPEGALPRVAVRHRAVAAPGCGYFPVLTRLRDGRLAAIVRGGAPHLGRAGRLDWVESRDGGRTWSEPRTVVDGPWDDRNPAFGQMRDGTLVLGYAECRSYNAAGEWDTRAGGFDLYYVTSTDGGRTWSNRRPLERGPLGSACSPYGRILTLRDGTALMNVYGNIAPGYDGPVRLPPGAGPDISGFLKSRDNGRTWGDFTLISAAGHNETALLEARDGRLLAAMRTVAGQLDVAESEDGGRTWSAPAPLTGGPRRGWLQHPADMVHLSGARIALFYGNRVAPFGVGVVVSGDDGRTWDFQGRALVAADSLHTDCGYPSAVAAPGGDIVCMYYTVGTTAEPGLTAAIAVRIRGAALPRPAGMQ